MGEPFLHPDLIPIVERAESLGVGIEMNTNCGLITQPIVDGLYRAGLTGLILSYQTPDAETFKTARPPPRLRRLPGEGAAGRGAEGRPRGAHRLEIDIMNTKYADSYKIVEEEEQALAS
jgi:MoaA/NifB/PqqE/SkfB family radical SAM enzyme